MKNGITYAFSYNFRKIKIVSSNDFSLANMLTLHVIIDIKSVLNKDQNHCNCNKFLEKSSNQFAKK